VQVRHRARSEQRQPDRLVGQRFRRRGKGAAHDCVERVGLHRVDARRGEGDRLIPSSVAGLAEVTKPLAPILDPRQPIKLDHACARGRPRRRKQRLFLII
jgi:hypothetical protein